MNSSVGVVLLARYSSSRLPGKALKTIGGKTVLQHIIERLQTVLPLESIIIATSDLESDKPIEDFANYMGVKCYRGSLEKVGERFYEAALQLGVEYACRINGDNILLAPEILQSLLDKASLGEYNFLSNVLGRTFPKGMSAEIVKLDYYQEHLPRIKSDSYCNEHVMVCLYNDDEPQDHFYLKNTDLPECSAIQLALDTEEDWQRTLWMMERIPAQKYDLKTTFEYYQRYEQSTKR